jgi:hypothetical protein
MTDDKPLGIQHAKITGQVMRDHWGPIIDRIADEIADPRDAQIWDLIAENEQLRRDHAAAVKEANIAKARLKGVTKQWHADRAALQDQSK